MRFAAVGIVALAWAVRVSAFAAFDGSPAPPGHRALGGAGCAMKGGLIAGSLNPAGLQGMSRPCATVWATPGIFGIEGLDAGGCAVGTPLAGVPVALHFTSLGFHGYREVTASLAAAGSIGGSTMVALRLNGDLLTIRGYGSALVPTLDAGVQLEVGSDWGLGFLFTNILAARIGAAGESLPIGLAAGCTYHTATREVAVYAACSRDLLSTLEWSAGVEYMPLASFVLRAGCSTEPALLSLGCAVLLSSVKLEYALVHHAQLGETHTIALSVGVD